MSWIALLAILAVMALVPVAQWMPPGQRWKWWSGVAAIVVMLIGVVLVDEISRRTLQYALLPVGLAWLVIGALAIAAFLRQRPVSGGILVAIFVVIGVGGNHAVGALLMSHLEQRIDVQTAESDERYDVVCLLGGGTNRRFDGVGQLGPAGDRLRVCARIYRQQRAPMILSTGIFASDTRMLLAEMGVPIDQVLVEPQPDNTAQEIALIKRLASEHGWKRIGVVSSAWHLPRVAQMAAHQGVSVLPLPCDWLGVVQPWTGEQVIPKGEGIRLVELAVKEHVGLMIWR